MNPKAPTAHTKHNQRGLALPMQTSGCERSTGYHYRWKYKSIWGICAPPQRCAASCRYLPNWCQINL